MVYVSCKYNTYIHVQHRISPDHYVLVCILYVYTYMTCTDTFIPEPNVFVCILYVYTYMTCTDTFIPEPNVRLRRREERRSSLSFSGGRTLSYFISNGAHILYVWYVHICTVIMYRYGIPYQYVCACILYVYAYIKTYRYVLYEQGCTYLVPIIRSNMCNTEYVQICTYSYVFCMYIRMKIRTSTFYMRNGVCILYV